jgi:5-dehydro-2-deoxygluconokinase
MADNGIARSRVLGFAVGRTTFWEALVTLRMNKITREVASARIARRYRAFADIFQSGKIHAS